MRIAFLDTCGRSKWHRDEKSGALSGTPMKTGAYAPPPDGRALSIIARVRLVSEHRSVPGITHRANSPDRSRCSATPGSTGEPRGELVLLFAWCTRLRAACNFEGRHLTLRLGTGDPTFPALAPHQYDSQLEERFAKEFRRRAPHWGVVREPEPITADGTLIFPDFALQHRSDPARRWLLEIVGFWTPDYAAARKLGQYRRARIATLVLCIDERRNRADADLPPGALVIRSQHRLDPATVLHGLGRARSSSEHKASLIGRRTGSVPVSRGEVALRVNLALGQAGLSHATRVRIEVEGSAIPPSPLRAPLLRAWPVHPERRRAAEPDRQRDRHSRDG